MTNLILDHLHQCYNTIQYNQYRMNQSSINQQQQQQSTTGTTMLNLEFVICQNKTKFNNNNNVKQQQTSSQTLPLSSKFVVAIVTAIALSFTTVPVNGNTLPKCHLSEMEQCFTKLHQLKDNNHDPSNWLTSIDGLNRICRVIKIDFVGCILAYLQKCGTPLHKELSKVLSEAILEHMDPICKPNSPFRDEIVSVAPCLVENVFEQSSFRRQCNNPFFTTIAWAEMNAHAEHPQRRPLDYIIDGGCCAYRRWEHCSMPLIVSNCNNEAERVLQQVLSKVLGGLPEFICAPTLFAEQSKICTALPSLAEQESSINITEHDQKNYSLFGVMKMFLVRDTTVTAK